MDEMAKKVSILIISKNAENTIKRLMDSIFAQTYLGIEIVCVDSSDDSTKGILEEYKRFSKFPFKLIFQEPKGCGAARNETFRNASGDIITVLDSDDYIPADYIEKLVKPFNEKDNIVGVYVNGMIVSSAKNLFSEFVKLYEDITLFRDEVFYDKPHKYLIATIKKVGYHSMVLNKLGDENLTIPVSHFILNELKATEQMVLYQHMLRIDSYALQVVHLEYYETSAFLNLFEFTMIAITIISLGSASGPVEIIKRLAVQYLIKEMVVYLAKLTGNAELAAIVGLVAMIALGEIDSDSAVDFMSAEGLINASTQFADNLTIGYNVELEVLQQDMDELNTLAEVRLEEIKEANPERSTISAEFLVALNSVDTTAFPAVKAQYNFDLLYNYDKIIEDYYNVTLQTGVI